MKDFDPQTEVHHCVKPGAGLADAPRAFQVKLTRIMIGKCGVRRSKIDAEQCVKHAFGRLVCITTIHFDDLQIADEANEVALILKELQAVFGE